MTNEQRKHMSGRKKLVLFGGGGLVLVLMAVAVFLWITTQSSREESAIVLTEAEKKAHKEHVEQVERDGAVRDSARDAIKDGDLAAAAEVYDNEIKTETDTVRKIQLYIDQSASLYDAGNAKEAIAVAKKAEPLSDDKFLVADWLSRIYEDQKQYALAATYYTLAGKWSDSSTNEAKLDKAYYDAEATRVGKLAQ